MKTALTIAALFALVLALCFTLSRQGAQPYLGTWIHRGFGEASLEIRPDGTFAEFGMLTTDGKPPPAGRWSGAGESLLFQRASSPNTAHMQWRLSDDRAQLILRAASPESARTFFGAESTVEAIYSRH